MMLRRVTWTSMRFKQKKAKESKRQQKKAKRKQKESKRKQKESKKIKIKRDYFYLYFLKGQIDSSSYELPTV